MSICAEQFVQYKHYAFVMGHEEGDKIQEKGIAVARMKQPSFSEVLQGHKPNTNPGGRKESIHNDLVQWQNYRWTSESESACTLDVYLQKCENAKSLSKTYSNKDKSGNKEQQEATPQKHNNLEVEYEEKKRKPITRDLPTSVRDIVEEKSREYVVIGDGSCLLRATAVHTKGDETKGPQLAIELNTHQSMYREYYGGKIEFPRTITFGPEEKTKKFESSGEYFDWLQESTEAVYMWRDSVDVIAISNSHTVEIDVIVYEEGKQPETRYFKPDFQFPWKKEDPMKPVNSMTMKQAKMVVINWKDTHFNLIVGPNHMIYKKASLRLQPACKLGMVAEGATGQPDNLEATSRLTTKCLKNSQFTNYPKPKQEYPKRIDELAISNQSSRHQETVGANYKSVTLNDQQKSKSTGKVEAVPTKIGPGPRKGHSKPAKKNCMQEMCDPRFFLSDPWSSREKVHIPVHETLLAPTTKPHKKKKKVKKKRTQKTRRKKEMLRELDNWWITHFGRCKVVVYNYNHKDKSRNLNYSTYHQNTLLLLHLLSVACFSRYHQSQQTRHQKLDLRRKLKWQKTKNIETAKTSGPSKQLRSSPIVKPCQNISVIRGDRLIVLGRGLRGGGPTKQPKEAAGVMKEDCQEGTSQGGAIFPEMLLGARSEEGSFKSVGQQDLAEKRHLYMEGGLPPYQFVGRFNNDTMTQCYLNSAVNLLFSSILANDSFTFLESRGPLISQLQLICGSYPGQVQDLGRLRMLVSATQLNSEFINTNRQQDPGEFLSVLLSAILEAMKSEEGAGRMVAGTGIRWDSLFTLVTIQHSWCLLHHSTFKEERHTLLQMPVVDPRTNMPLDTLDNIIKSFCAQEEIEESKCPTCTQQLFQRREPSCPAVLILQYNRFFYDQEESTAVKLSHPIQSQESLTFSGEDYKLRGFLCHTGDSCYSGHYFAVVRCAVSGDYFLANDNDPIVPFSQEEAQAVRLYAYILLYEKQTSEHHDQLFARLREALQHLRRAGQEVKTNDRKRVGKSKILGLAVLPEQKERISAIAIHVSLN